MSTPPDRLRRATPTLASLRAHAVGASLFAPVALGQAVARLGFVQADPIRAPARAQDLILRHRVTGYRAGDLERRFVRLGLEEDFLYAYGFMPRETMRLLHPRPDPAAPDRPYRPTGLAAEVLAMVCATGEIHPRDLEEHFGRGRAVNAWGGFSKETTHVLHSLHYHGLLRVVRRRDGIRVYAQAPRPANAEALPPAERIRRLLRLVVSILAPISDVSLRGVLVLLRRGAPGLGPMGPAIEAMLAAGDLEGAVVDGERYLWPKPETTPAAKPGPLRGVRFLAPFDPVVWDRRRFAHLWGWDYRFEAYTPAPKRQFGYYALPMLWRDQVVGWVNAAVTGGQLTVTPGFVGAPPRGRDFQRGFDAEVARLAVFLA
jgi:uncharacterized protein YcaQ